MQELQQSAIGADAIRTGVTNAPDFELLSQQIHGFGLRYRTGRIPELSGPPGWSVVLPTIRRAPHDRSLCQDYLCAHPDHGISTAGPNFDGGERAGQRTPNAGEISVESRTYHPLNEYVGEFSVQDAIEPTFRESPGPIQLGDSVKNLMRASIQPDHRGGGSSGRKRNDGTPPDFGAVERALHREIAKYV